MDICVNKKNYIISLIGVIIVIVGVLMSEKATEDKKPLTHGMIIFVIGWLVFLYAIFKNSPKLFSTRNILVLIGTIMIMAGAMLGQKVIIEKRDELLNMNLIFTLPGILFGVGWLILGYSVAINDNIAKPSLDRLFFSVPGSIFIILSMMHLLIRQRINKDVYGWGMPLFIGGWLAMGTANAINY